MTCPTCPTMMLRSVELDALELVCPMCARRLDITTPKPAPSYAPITYGHHGNAPYGGNPRADTWHTWEQPVQLSKIKPNRKKNYPVPAPRDITMHYWVVESDHPHVAGRAFAFSATGFDYWTDTREKMIREAFQADTGLKLSWLKEAMTT